MIIRKTSKTKVKKIIRGRHENIKDFALYRVTTYWLLVIPVYSYEEHLE